MSHTYKLIVLDRDGVINKDSPNYIKSPKEWVAIPKSLEAIAKLKHANFKIAVATNQSGLARNYFSNETLDKIHQKMVEQIERTGGKLDTIFFCPHGPNDNCDCRKPKPGLLLQAARKFHVDPAKMVMIGDSFRDIQAAINCGADSIFIKSNEKPNDLSKAKDLNIPIYDSLYEATDYILSL